MGSYLEHQNLIKKFKTIIQEEIPGIRVFDRHIGLLYTKRGTPIRINIKGMADCYALLPTDFGLLHLEIEAKTGNARQSKEQKVWQKYIEKSGGDYFILRDIEETIREIKKRVEKAKH